MSQCLPDDVVNDILTGLPVKSIIRFRCVSKSWNSKFISPVFITMHLNRAKSLSNKKNHNGYLLYMPAQEYTYYLSREDLFTVVCNSDRTLTHMSTYKFPFSDEFMVGFCNGMFCYANNDEEYSEILYLWNPSIRKYKMLVGTPLTDPLDSVTFGLAYHSQNNDYKILRFMFTPFQREKVVPTEAEVYTLSTDSWRTVIISVESEPNIGTNVKINESPCLFFNGALHSIASSSRDHDFILSFDVNDERFHAIMLPQNYLDGIDKTFQSLVVFKGSLALIVFSRALVQDESPICYIWVMKEYGVVKSWTKKSVPMSTISRFFGCTINGELLIEKYDPFQSFSFDPESLKEEILNIPMPGCMIYTANFVESLVLLDRGN